MGNYNDVVGSSGFTTMPESKYYDKYTNDNPSIACNGSECLSHALSEITDWYDDKIIMVNETYSWLVHSGHFLSSTGAGIFLSQATTALGATSTNGSFRLVATIR